MAFVAPLHGQTYTFTTLAGSTSAGSSDGSGTAARFSGLRDVAVDQSGTLYVVDTGNSTIRKVSPSGAVTTIAGLAGVDGDTDGTGSVARFNSPHGIAVDASGNVYVAESNSGTIRKITPAGLVSTLAGKSGVDGSSDGTGPSASFSFPHRIAIDSAGNLFVTDHENYTIRKITPAGVVTTVAGKAGVQGTADGTGANARFGGPIGIAIDPAGVLYVADGTAIRKVTAAGVVTTFAGNANATGSTDGTGATARFSFLLGLAIDGAGNLYATDSSAVRKITPEGVVTTIGGSTAQNGSADGVGTSARFSVAHGIAVDRNGAIYVADTGNNEIRKGTPNTASTAHLVNLSSRGFVGTGDSALIGGFVVSGQGPKTFLIRGIGPTLSQFGVGGALADPVLRLFDASNKQLDENNDWGGGAALSAAFAATGAFSLAAASKDSVLLITVAPGNYTAQVSGANNTTGIGMIEIYEMP